jgi:hypothetical protein
MCLTDQELEPARLHRRISELKEIMAEMPGERGRGSGTGGGVPWPLAPDPSSHASC